MTNPKLKLLKKITIREIVGVAADEDIKEYMKKIAKDEPEIAAIVGEVTGYGDKVTTFGISQFLSGTFIAQNRMTGDNFKGSKLYLPKDITETIIAAVKNRVNATDVTPIHLTIKVIPDKSQGFTYVCEPIKTIATVSKEAELLASITGLGAPVPLKAIPAPVKKTA